jgi:hypothetical protein
MTSPLILWKKCDHCGGSGRINVGSGKPRFAALAWLEDNEGVCHSCHGSGRVQASIQKKVLVIDRGWVYEEIMPGVQMHRRDLEDTHDCEI